MQRSLRPKDGLDVLILGGGSDSLGNAPVIGQASLELLKGTFA